VEQRNTSLAALRLRRVETVFLRLVALVLLVFALQYWMRVTGMAPGDESGFDRMSNHWRVVAASLSVVLPLAALGLWGLHAWGVVVWIGAAVAEIVIYGMLQANFGANLPHLAFHVAALFLLAAIFGARQLLSRRRPERRPR